MAEWTPRAEDLSPARGWASENAPAVGSAASVQMVKEGGDTPSFAPLEDVRAVRWLARWLRLGCLRVARCRVKHSGSTHIRACPCCWLAQTWGMYFLAVFIIMLIFVPVYKASVDPTIYGAKKKKSKMSGETVKKALQASKKA